MLLSSWYNVLFLQAENDTFSAVIYFFMSEVLKTTTTNIMEAEDYFHYVIRLVFN